VWHHDPVGDARPELLAEGLGIDPARRSDADLAEAIVDAVVAVRDGLGLPTRLRDLDPVDRDDFPAIAEFVLEDFAMDRRPEGLDPTAQELEAILEEAW
jgi:alcohol dehydrogenase